MVKTPFRSIVKSNNNKKKTKTNKHYMTILRGFLLIKTTFPNIQFINKCSANKTPISCKTIVVINSNIKTDFEY